MRARFPNPAKNPRKLGEKSGDLGEKSGVLGHIWKLSQVIYYQLINRFSPFLPLTFEGGWGGGGWGVFIFWLTGPERGDRLAASAGEGEQHLSRSKMPGFRPDCAGSGAVPDRLL